MKTPFTIDKIKTAIVVIDLQKGITSGETYPHSAKDVIEKTAQLLKIFRKNNMPIFLVRVTFGSDPKERLNLITDVTWNSSRQMPDDWAEIVPELSPERNAVIIIKKQWGAFYGTELELQLRRRKIDTIVLCGIATHMGVESTARFAYEYGYNQIFAEDAMSAMSKEEHEHTVGKILPRLGLVRSTEEIIEVLEKE
ncbi:MAG: hydrolase [Candidatus Pacebacteria bacterium]|nr:hydrolase [Candidatus Paceibacterota bacterium]